MEKSLEEKETLSQDGIIGTSDVEIEDTFVWLMSTITVYIAITTIWQITLHSSYTVPSDGRHFLIKLSLS
jgi:hypothetical protein